MPVFGPLIRPIHEPDGMLLWGHVAQSLDGFIALSDGRSRWISGAADIAHTHRLRALADAVVVGAGTVLADNPQLTTRLVEGPSPVRVVLDPTGRLPQDRRVFQTAPATLVVHGPTAPRMDRVGQAEVLRISGGPFGLDMRGILGALLNRGLRRIFIEGGGITVSRFLQAGLLHRLHVTIAPVLIGSGIPAFRLPPPTTLDRATRLRWTAHPMGADTLLDIALDDDP